MLWLAVVVVGGCAPEPPKQRAVRSRSRYTLELTFPILERERIVNQIMGMDHDPDVYDGVKSAICTNFEGEGFPYCYDEHDGTDFDLRGGFSAMDDGSATVIAAAEGVVLRVVDDNYDRCHLDVNTLSVDCDGYPIASNVVTIEHPDGHKTVYKHLMQYSATVEVGQNVEQGEPLGLVGSSGYSTAPHLHLELRAPGGGGDIDPFAGPYSQERSWWCEQWASDGLPGSCAAR